MSINLTVKDSANITLEKYIAKQAIIPFSLLRKLFRKRLVLVDNKRTKADYVLKDGQEITIKANLEQNKKLTNLNSSNEEKTKLKKILDKNILLHDQNILAFNKPINVATQGGTKIHNSIDDTLSLYSEDNIKPRLVHRLDKETSGVLITAKNNQTAIILNSKFKNRDIKKTYLSILVGTPKAKQGTISIDIERHDEKNNIFHAQESLTRYKLIKKLKGNLSLVEFYPVTGRKHQIRITAQHMGTPILGDNKYGDFLSNKELKVKSLFLHCLSMSFEINLEHYKISSEIPNRFLEFIE